MSWTTFWTIAAIIGIFVGSAALAVVSLRAIWRTRRSSAHPRWPSFRIAWRSYLGLVVGCSAIPALIVGMQLTSRRLDGLFQTTNRGTEVILTAPPVIINDTVRPVGTAISLTTLRVTVHTINSFSCSEAQYEASYGPICLAVDASFTNISAGELTIAKTQSFLQNAEASPWRSAYSRPLEEAVPREHLPWIPTIEPGQTIRGTLFYEAVPEAGQLYWIYREEATGKAAIVAFP